MKVWYVRSWDFELNAMKTAKTTYWNRFFNILSCTNFNMYYYMYYVVTNNILLVIHDFILSYHSILQFSWCNPFNWCFTIVYLTHTASFNLVLELFILASIPPKSQSWKFILVHDPLLHSLTPLLCCTYYSLFVV